MSVYCPWCGQETEYLGIKAVANLMGVAVRTARKYAANGRLPGADIVMGINSRYEWRIPTSAVISYLQENEN